MSTRYHCEYSNCNCMFYIKRNNHRCLKCNHGDVWHSLKEPPNNGYLSFVSPRQFARRPYYKRHNVINIFEPQVPPLPSDDDIPFCTDVEILPV